MTNFQSKKFLMNFGLVLLGIVIFERVVSATDESNHCNFNGGRQYNVSDLLFCINELAGKILQQQTNTRNGAVGSGRVLTGPVNHKGPLNYGNGVDDYNYSHADDDDEYPDIITGTHQKPQINKPKPGYYQLQTKPQQTSSLPFLGGMMNLPNLMNILNLGNFSPSGLANINFFGALNSIARHDDLKCVPRILCEVTSGSRPGSTSSRNTPRTFGFGRSIFQRMLSIFSEDAITPLWSFGKAAVLGFTNRGQTSACYEEYSRCPYNEEQLIEYLNNHNGGFFRLFGTNGFGNFDNHQSSNYQQDHPVHYQIQTSGQQSQASPSKPHHQLSHRPYSKRNSVQHIKNPKQLLRRRHSLGPTSTTLGQTNFMVEDVGSEPDYRQDFEINFLTLRRKTNRRSEPINTSQERQTVRQLYNQQRNTTHDNIQRSANSNFYQPHQQMISKYESPINNFDMISDKKNTSEKFPSDNSWLPIHRNGTKVKFPEAWK